MTSPDINNPRDAELWQRVAGPDEAADEPAPDALDLAAYVDGRLDEAAQARVESYLAGNARARRGLGEIRFLLAAPARKAPPRVLTAAKALVPLGRSRRATGRPPSRWRLALQTAGAVAAAVLIGVTGYFAGAGTYRSRLQTERAVVTAVSFDLTDPESDPLQAEDEFDLALARNGEGGKP